MPFPILLALELAQAGYSAFGANKAQQGLDASNVAGRPTYKVDPALQGAADRANRMSAYGFSPEERAGFRQNVAQDINTQSRRALDIGGGNLARTISRFGTIANLGAENKFAAQDAQQHSNNIRYADNLTREIQGIHNRETGAGINNYNRTQEAYGKAKNMNISNIFSSLALAGQYGAFGKAANPGGGTTGVAGNAPFQAQPTQDWSNPYGAPRAQDWHQLYMGAPPDDFTQTGARYGVPRENFNY